MKKTILLATLVAGSALFTSCVTPERSLYSWYDSENVSYQYTKKHTDELQQSLIKQYEKMLQQQRGVRGVVPPGFYADYGFALYASGKKEQGVAMMKKEVELYPESETFVNRILKQIER